MKPTTRKTLSVYWQHIKRYPKTVLLSWVMLLMGIVASIVIPLWYKRFFDILSGDIVVNDIFTSAFFILLAVIGTYLVMNIGFRVSHACVVYYVSRIERDTASTCFDYLHKHSYHFFTSNFTGSLVKKVNRFIDAFGDMYGQIFWELTGIIVRGILFSTILFFINPVIAIILFVWSLIFAGVAALIIRYRIKFDILRAEADSEVTGYLADTITNSVNLKLFTSFRREKKGFANVTEKARKLKQKSWYVDTWLDSAQAILFMAVEFILMFYSLVLWRNGALTLGSVILVQSYLISLSSQLWDFSSVIKTLYRALADAEEMSEIFLTPHEVKDVRNAKALKVTEGKIEFKEVEYSYHKTRTVLKKFDLTIEPGEKVALVGPSGAGKSTIVKSLFRFFDLQGGKILIDGQDIAKVTQESLLKQVSLVPQDPILFHRSLKENIGYGNAKASQKEIMKAAKLAHAHDFIKDFPEGYDTYVGERGVKLSGGERQRVAIARAIVKDAPILVLDEATSSLDSESEKLIQDALQKLMKGRTTIVIAHRLSTIMAMDRILVVDKGKIVETGSHEELLKKRGGLYKKLWELQAGGFLG